MSELRYAKSELAIVELLVSLAARSSVGSKGRVKSEEWRVSHVGLSRS